MLFFPDALTNPALTSAQVTTDMGELDEEEEVNLKIVMHPRGPKGNPGPQVNS